MISPTNLQPGLFFLPARDKSWSESDIVSKEKAEILEEFINNSYPSLLLSFNVQWYELFTKMRIIAHWLGTAMVASQVLFTTLLTLVWFKSTDQATHTTLGDGSSIPLAL